MKQLEDWVAYHVFGTKDTDYAMKLINTYGTLEPTDKRTRRKFNHGGVWRQMSSCTRRWLKIIFCINIKLVTTTIEGMHLYTLIELGLPNIGLIVALLGTLQSQK